MILKKSIKKITILLLSILFFAFLYIFSAFLFTLFPSKKIDLKKEHTIYLLYNNMHSDIVLELNTSTINWNKKLYPLIKKQHNFLAFGWGDKETYLNSPTWKDIKFLTTLKALFINTSSVIHVHSFSNIDAYKNTKKIHLSTKQLKQLEESLIQSFSSKEKILEGYKGYGYNDFFYNSIYSYNIFNTCNTWSGDRLRDAKISMSYWTPFSHNIVNSLP